MMLRSTPLLGGALGLAVLGMLVSAHPAAATSLTLAGRELVVEPPAGSCAYDLADPREAGRVERFQALQGKSGRLLIAFGDCTEFMQARSGQWDRLVDQGQLVLLLAEGEPAPAIVPSRAAYLAGVAAAAPSAPVPAQPTDAKPLGLLGRDDDAVYFGVALPQGIDGAPQVRAAVVARSLVDFLPIALTVYGPGADDSHLRTLVATARTDIRGLIAANAMVEQTAQPPVPPAASGRWLKLAVVAIAAIAAGISLLLVRALRRR